MDFLIASLVLAMTLAALANGYSDGFYSVSKREADATRQAMISLKSSRQRTISKSVSLCRQADSSMTCAWLLMDSESNYQVSEIACMDESSRKCAQYRLDCSQCDSCHRNFTNLSVNRYRTVKCFCSCGVFSELNYECDERCDGSKQCLLSEDEDDCKFSSEIYLRSPVFAPFWNLIVYIMVWAAWLGIGGVVVIIYYRMRARGRCGPLGESAQPQPPQQQQQLIYQYPLLVPQQQPVA